MDIGMRIRQLRTKNNLTLEELASRTELSKGFLSQLENGTAVPSIPTLEDIVEALGTTMSAFFREESNEPYVFGQKDFFIDEKNGCRISYVIPNAQKNEMEPILVELSPGSQSQELAPFEGEEFGYVVKGKITLVVEDCPDAIVKKGETFYLHGNKNHYLINASDKPAAVLWITTPPEF